MPIMISTNWITTTVGEITGQARNRRFRFDLYLRLFEDPAEDRP